MNLLASGSVFNKPWFIAVFCVLAVAIVIFVLDVNYKYFAKRACDIIVSALCIIVCSPVYLFLAVWGKNAIKKAGGGKLFKHTCFAGKNAHPVMVTSYSLKSATGEELGSFSEHMKKSSLQRLPYLLDIFLGKLSFIGPKLLPLIDRDYVEDEYMDRFAVRPGVISPLAFGGAEDLKYEEVFALELKYVKNLEMFKDIGILFKTMILGIRGESQNVLGEAKDKGYLDTLVERGDISIDEAHKAKESSLFGPEGTILKPRN